MEGKNPTHFGRWRINLGIRPPGLSYTESPPRRLWNLPARSECFCGSDSTSPPPVGAGIQASGRKFGTTRGLRCHRQAAPPGSPAPSVPHLPVSPGMPPWGRSRPLRFPPGAVSSPLSSPLPRAVPGLRAGSPAAAAPRGAGGRSGAADSSRPGRRRAGSMARMARSGGTLWHSETLCLGRTLCRSRTDYSPARLRPAPPGSAPPREPFQPRPEERRDETRGDGCRYPAGFGPPEKASCSPTALTLVWKGCPRQNSAKETDVVVQLHVRMCPCWSES